MSQTRKFISSLLLICGLLGCSSGDKAAILEDEAFKFPQQFEEDNTKWTKSPELPQTEIRRLVAYFKQNPSLAEGTIVRGEPTLYVNSRKHKRFYWARSGAEQIEWLFVQFTGNRVSLTNGNGSPIQR